jgi:hypothetical protein
MDNRFYTHQPTSFSFEHMAKMSANPEEEAVQEKTETQNNQKKIQTLKTKF